METNTALSVLSKVEGKKKKDNTLDLKNKRNPEITQHREKSEIDENSGWFIKSKSLSDEPTCTSSRI